MTSSITWHYTEDDLAATVQALHDRSAELEAEKFASEAHLQAFKANPARYVPQYGGFCAFGVAVSAKFDGDPELWRIEEGNLYLNLNPDIQDQWEKYPGPYHQGRHELADDQG